MSMYKFHEMSVGTKKTTERQPGTLYLAMFLYVLFKQILATMTAFDSFIPRIF